MTFIRTIPPSEAEGLVREMYQQAQSPIRLRAELGAGLQSPAGGVRMGGSLY